jgi:phage gp29-like protein
MADGGRPNYREIATIEPSRDVTATWTELLETHDPILRSRGVRYEIYDEVARDWQVAACWAQRSNAITRCSWQVVPGKRRGANPSRQDKKAAEFMSALLESMPFDYLTEQIHWAIFYGFGVAELNYAKDGTQVVLLDDVDDAGIYQGLKIKDRRRFVFHREDGLRMLTQQASFLGESLPPRKFWVLSTGSQISDDPHGLGLAYLCYYPNRFRRDNFKNWLRYGDKVSKNQIYGRTPHADGKKREEFRKVVNALREGGSGVIDEEEVIEMLDMATNSSDYAVLDERIDNALAKIILGQVGTSEGVAGQHRGDMQRDVRQDFVSRDSYLITDAWNRGPGTWLTNWNFPGAVPPILSRQVEGKPSPEEQSDNDAKIFAFGWTKSLEQVSEHYGEGYLGVGKDNSMPAIPVDRLPHVLDLLSKVASGELTVDQGRKLALYMLPGYTEEMISELVVEPPEEPDAGPLFDEAIAGGEKAAPEEEPAFATPDQDDIDLYGLDLQEQAAKTINQWLGQIRELGKDSADLPEFAAQIYDLYPDLSGQALTEVMAQAQMAASWIGADEAQGGDSPEFAAKAKKCKTGKTCGNSCISKNKECRKKPPEKAVEAVKAVAGQLDEKPIGGASDAKAEPKTPEKIGGNGEIDVNDSSLLSKFDAFREKGEEEEDLNIEPEKTSIEGVSIEYTAPNMELRFLLPEKINKEAIEHVFENGSGRVLFISWGVRHPDGELDAYGDRNDDFSMDDALKIAMSARRAYKNQVQPLLREGDILVNTPIGGKGSARARAYERQGFSDVHENENQFAIVGKGGKLIPIQFGDLAQGGNSPEFAVKAKKCKTGKTCGNSCISKNKECRKKPPEKAVEAVKAVASQLDEKPVREAPAAKAEPKMPEKIGGNGEIDVNDESLLSKFDAFSEKGEKEDALNIEPEKTSIEGISIEYTAPHMELRALLPETINKEAIEHVFENGSGRVLYMSWGVRHPDGELDIFGGRNGEFSSDEALKIAMSARRAYKNQVQPLLKEGDILVNTPLEGKGGARAEAYKRQGFSEVHDNENQYAMVGKGGKLIPIQFGDLA